MLDTLSYPIKFVKSIEDDKSECGERVNELRSQLKVSTFQSNLYIELYF